MTDYQGVIKNRITTVFAMRFRLLKAILFTGAAAICGAGMLYLLLFFSTSGEALASLVPGLAIATVLLAYRAGVKGFTAGLLLNLAAATATLVLREQVSGTIFMTMLLVLLYATAGAAAISYWRKKELAGQQNLRWLSATDSLTQVYNHRYFHQRLGEELSRARRTQTEVSLAFIDLDKFKKYNDRNGHILGDQALKKTAAFLDDETRLCDIVCRYGGDEFVIILPDTSAEEAAMIARRLGDNFKNCKMPTGKESQTSLTLSIGISSSPKLAADHNELIKQADRALFTAKKKGRNLTVVYNGEPAGYEPDSESIFSFENCEKTLIESYRAINDRLNISSCTRVRKSADGKGNSHVILGRAIGLGHGKIDADKLVPYFKELNLH